MGRKAIDETGNKYNRLTVIRRATEDECPQRITKAAYWVCQCDCGNITVVEGKHLRTGHTKSCGCYREEQIKKGQYSGLIDLTGQRFGRLTVLKPTNQRGKNRTMK